MVKKAWRSLPLYTKIMLPQGSINTKKTPCNHFIFDAPITKGGGWARAKPEEKNNGGSGGAQRHPRSLRHRVIEVSARGFRAVARGRDVPQGAGAPKPKAQGRAEAPAGRRGATSEKAKRKDSRKRGGNSESGAKATKERRAEGGRSAPPKGGGKKREATESYTRAAGNRVEGKVCAQTTSAGVGSGTL